MSKRSHAGDGPSQRQLQVGELIRRKLADVLMRGDIHEPELNRLSITVGEVRASSDLKLATVFVLPLNGEDQDEVIGLLARNKGQLRKIIGRELSLKFTPDLRFRLDESFDRMDEIRRLLAQENVRRDIEG